jgi:hypothetical protein
MAAYFGLDAYGSRLERGASWMTLGPWLLTIPQHLTKVPARRTSLHCLEEIKNFFDRYLNSKLLKNLR